MFVYMWLAFGILVVCGIYWRLYKWISNNIQKYICVILYSSLLIWGLAYIISIFTIAIFLYNYCINNNNNNDDNNNEWVLFSAFAFICGCTYCHLLLTICIYMR